MVDVGQQMSVVTLDMFRSMMHLEAEEGPTIDLPTDGAPTEIVALIGLSGTRCGMVGVYSSGRLARRMAGALLGAEPEAIDEEVRDSFGEVANIIAGNVATALCDVGELVQLSLPSVIVGRDLVTSILDTTPPRQARAFLVGDDRLYVELALKRLGD